MAGRKTKLTPEAREEIIKLAGVGLTDAAIAEYIGVGPDTFCVWKRKPQFSQDLKKARQKKKAWLIEQIRKAGARQWQANAWLLERIWNSEFSERRSYQMEHSGSVMASVASILNGGKNEPGA